MRDTFRPRFAWRPYVLRAYFDTQLLIAESKGRMAHDFRVFFMGHKGSIEARYTTNKRILPEALTAEMRDSERAEEFLDQGGADPVLEQRQEAREIIEQTTPEQLGRVLGVLQAPARRPGQTVVSSEQAERLIASGYKFVGCLPGGKVVLEK